MDKLSFIASVCLMILAAHYSRADIFNVSRDLSRRSAEAADSESGEVRGSKKSRMGDYLAERKAFTEFVTEKYGASVSGFYRDNSDFNAVRRAFPQEAEELTERIGKLRGAVKSELAYTSNPKEGTKLIKKLRADEAAIAAAFSALTARAGRAAAEERALKDTEQAKREIAELKSRLSAERERLEAAERKVRELESSLSNEREARRKAESRASELASRLKDERFGNELLEREVNAQKAELVRRSENAMAQNSAGADSSGVKNVVGSSGNTTDARDRAIISEMIEDRLVQRLIISGKAGRTECDMLKSQLLDKLMSYSHESRVDTANLLINEVIRTFGL